MNTNKLTAPSTDLRYRPSEAMTISFAGGYLILNKMSNNKAGEHTQGEFMIGRPVEIEIGLFECKVYIKDGIKNPLHAKVYGNTFKEAENNARLIASAPKMLEALEIIRKVINGENRASIKVQLHIIDKAIKSAKGESNHGPFNDNYDGGLTPMDSDDL